MKRTVVMITAAALACTLGATGVWAAGPRRAAACQRETAPLCRFVDENGDGVCDNRLRDGCRYDADGDGLCDRNYCGRRANCKI